jgi:hypothetical protein
VVPSHLLAAKGVFSAVNGKTYSFKLIETVTNLGKFGHFSREGREKQTHVGVIDMPSIKVQKATVMPNTGNLASKSATQPTSTNFNCHETTTCNRVRHRRVYIYLHQ